MARPKGTKNRPGSKKPGPKPLFTPEILAHMTPQEALEVKAKVIQQLNDGLATTLAEACRNVGLQPVRVRRWAETDRDLRESLAAAREVVADDIEKRLEGHGHFIPQMMILKGIRPMYRDNAKLGVDNTRLETLLKEIRDLAQRPQLSAPLGVTITVEPTELASATPKV